MSDSFDVVHGNAISCKLQIWGKN